MTWTSPMTFSSGAVLTAAQLNTYLRDNLNETAPAKATTAGSIFVTTSLNTIAERVPTTAYVSTQETTSSTSYTTLATAGPSVTVTTGSNALVLMSYTVFNNSAGGQSFMTPVVTGASALSASDSRALRFESSQANDTYAASYVYLETGLTSGSNVFTANYKVAVAGTSSFSDRRMTVVPF